jgi:ligand-binding sensor domain-containing protein
MLKYFFIFNCSLCIFHFSPAQLPPIGYWRDHLPYHQARSVVAAGKEIFCATPYSVFSIDPPDNNISRYSKINGLHEVGVSAIQWDEPAGRLIIAYTNSNIDILSNGTVYNIDAVRNKDITGDKSVYRIFCYQDMVYLCSGLGVIVIDEKKNEVKDTYIIGNGGSKVRVNGLTTDDRFFYAATDEGLKRAPVNNNNLSDYSNWQLLSGTSGLSSGTCKNVVNLQQAIVVQKNDSLLILDSASWNLLYTDNWHINNASVSGNRVLLSQQKGDSARVLVINNNGTVEKSFGGHNLLFSPQQAILLQNSVFVADSISGLVEFNGTATAQFQPNSPLSVATGSLTVQNGTLWVASGGLTANQANTFSKNGPYRFAGGEWTNYPAPAITAMDSVYDLVTVAVDPSDQSAWAGSFGGGLLHLKTNNTAVIFSKNSPLDASLADPDKYNIAGLAFDRNNNLWISDYGAANNLAVKKKDGNWRKFAVPFPLSNNAVSQLVADDNNQVWMVAPGGNGLVCFNYGQSIDNPADDQWKWYRAGMGKGNLPDKNVNCIARDKNGFIWVGTANGIGVIQCIQEVFSARGCEALLPIVQQDNFAGYLFRGQAVQCIAVDGADRKWIGTKNGVWLISPDGDKTIYRFAAENSPLLNNNVNAIAIDGVSGEVFFSTASGICSFRSTATTGGTTNSNILVFPNPVPPGYSGTIAIRGLVDNAVVKITELNGRLVYQARALGGQAVWNGRDYKGHTIATGVYLVWVTDDTKQEKAVTKIVFISR